MAEAANSGSAKNMQRLIYEIIASDKSENKTALMWAAERGIKKYVEVLSHTEIGK